MVRFSLSSILFLNPHYSFLRVPKHRYTNTGLNGVKIRQNKAAGTSGTGTGTAMTGTCTAICCLD